MAKRMTKSEHRIRTALIDLMEEKGFYNIKVADILERADVSRSTFYTIYEDKYQLIRIIQAELLNGLGEIMNRVRSGGRQALLVSEDSQTNPVFIEYFQYVKTNERLWRLFFIGKGESDFSDQLSHFFYRKILETQTQWEPDPAIPIKHTTVLCSWAYVALFSYWTTTGMKESSEEMARTLTVFWDRFMHW